MSEAKTTIRTTCPRDCYDTCGVLVVKRGDTVAKVLGDPDHPVSRGALCGKCAIAYNGVWRDPDARLLRPLRRVGRKGEGRFEPVSWEAALSTIAERLQDIVARHGPAPIWHTHYTGTCAKIAGGFPLRFFNRLGASEVVPDSICNMAGQVALEYVYRQRRHRFRSAQRARRRLPAAVGRQSVRLGAPCSQALVQGGARHQDRRRPRAPRDGRGGRPSSAALPGQRCRAGLRHAACDRPRRAARPDVPCWA